MQGQSGRISEEAARTAVRDELARRAEGLAWLARTAVVDVGTVSDFLSGNRWPRIDTLAKFDSAFGWSPGTLDRIARGQPAESLPAGVDRDALRALQGALDDQIQHATDEWVAATIQHREAGLAVEAAEKKRAELIAGRDRIADQLEAIERTERRSDGPVPTMPMRRATDPEDADYTDRRGGA